MRNQRLDSAERKSFSSRVPEFRTRPFLNKSYCEAQRELGERNTSLCDDEPASQQQNDASVY